VVVGACPVRAHPAPAGARRGAVPGGPKQARDQFAGRPWFDATVEFCERYDENCFDPGYDWLPLAHFAPAVEEVFTREPAFR
jgi:predicted HD phosphohydrolase